MLKCYAARVLPLVVLPLHCIQQKGKLVCLCALILCLLHKPLVSQKEAKGNKHRAYIQHRLAGWLAGWLARMAVYVRFRKRELLHSRCCRSDDGFLCCVLLFYFLSARRALQAGILSSPSPSPAACGSCGAVGAYFFRPSFPYPAMSA